MNAPAEPVLQSLPIERISLGNNYRHRRPANWESKLVELGASMREKGQLEPVLVRPNPRASDEGAYEIVFGERRYRAAHKAGLTHLLAIVRDVADEDVLDLQLTENGDREDAHPLDEAEAFAELVRRGKSPAEIAGRMNRDVRYVAQRLALNTLTDKCRRALDEGQIIFGVALQIARIPNAKLQDEALKELTPWRDEAPLTVKQAAGEIEENFLLQLDEAIFDRADGTLVPKAGPCTTCPKRTGNQTELFGDVKSPDVCTDRLCFKAKQQAHGELVMARAKKDGKKIVSVADAKKLWPYEHSNHLGGSQYAELGGTVSDPKTHREVSVRALLKGRDFDTFVARNPHKGTVHELVARGAIDAAFRARAKDRGEKDEKKAAKATPSQKAAKAKAKLQEEAKDAIRLELCKAVAESCEKLGANGTEPFMFAMLPSLLMSLEGLDRVIQRRGLSDPKNKRRLWGDALDTLVTKEAKARGLSWLRGLLVETLLFDTLEYEYGPKDAYTKRQNAVLEAFGVDRKAVEARIVAELKAKREAGVEAKPKG